MTFGLHCQKISPARFARRVFSYATPAPPPKKKNGSFSGGPLTPIHAPILPTDAPLKRGLSAIHPSPAPEKKDNAYVCSNHAGCTALEGISQNRDCQREAVRWQHIHRTRCTSELGKGKRGKQCKTRNELLPNSWEVAEHGLQGWHTRARQNSPSLASIKTCSYCWRAQPSAWILRWQFKGKCIQTLGHQ